MSFRYPSQHQYFRYRSFTTGIHLSSNTWALNLVNHGRSPFATASETHIASSAGSCTESFHRFSQVPVEKIPPAGLFPSTA